MIVIDTSALIAILLKEPDSRRCVEALKSQPDRLIAAGTLAEALVVAGRRGLADEMADLVGGFGIEVVALTEAGAKAVGYAYRRWGKGAHAASLNFGDCFAYALARERGCSLLFVGKDFAQTDVTPA